MKEWKKPEIQDLTLQATKEEGQPYFYWPWSPACDDAANYTGEKCPKTSRACKYYCWGKCTAPAAPAVS